MRGELAGNRPVVGLFRRLRELAFGGGEDGNSLRETIEELLEDEADHLRSLTEHERRLLLNALSFGELEVADVMVPRSDVKAIELESSLDDVVRAMRDAGHTRLPVFRQTLDDVVGLIHIKDVLPFWGDGVTFRLENQVRKILHVPPSMRVIDLLLTMRDTRNHMAVVVDEYGGTDGLVTIEDLIEEIVGEIQDEHDRILQPKLLAMADGSWEADARIEVETLESKLGVELLDEDRRDDADTLGGLVFMLMDRVPARGEVISHPAGLDFEVLDADPRRVKRLRIRHRTADDPGPA
ncbi:MAG: HlyC/CorC family transporter [Geminicoccaceae bacterium]|nr:MAG: HlyC/CorC family transporter [Geminicoccaceae bacterium]